MQRKHPSNTAILILAAGRSSRMGRPKQLLNYRGKSLLQHTIDIALESEAKTVIVVLGYEAGKIENYIQKKTAVVLKNAEWESGMATSISMGISFLQEQAVLADNVLIMVCDQPHVSKELINRLIQTQEENKHSILACSYANTIGTPAIFSKEYFDELSKLRGDRGAKSILNKYAEIVGNISFSKGSIDIDTSENYKNLIE